MAVNFSEKTNRQKYLILFLIVIILVTFFLLRKSSSEPGVATESMPVIFQPPEIEIDFELLKSPKIGELQVFEEIGPFEGQVGRDNPFISY